MSFARPRLVERRMSRAVHHALVSIALASAAIFVPGATAATPDAEVARSYTIPAGPLGRTLSSFAAQTGIALSFDSTLTDGILSPGLSGLHGAREAADQLLTGSGLEMVPRADGSYTLRKTAASAGPATGAPRDGAVLPVVVVTAEGYGATTEGTGSYTTNSASTATRLNLSLRETPQSVSVITRQRMDDQGLSQLTDVVTQTPGLTLSATGNLGSDSSSIYSRGFAVENYQTDGVGQIYSGYNAIFQTNDMAIYDRVEVVRGATGLMNGVGSPSATINLMRKRPTAQFQSEGKIEFGSWNYRRVEADISTPLNAAGSVRARAVAAYQDNDSYIDRLHEKKKIFYGIVEADLTPATLLSAGYTLQHHDATGHARSGRPAYFTDGTRAIWGRSDSAAATWAYSKRHGENLFASLEHQFDNAWKFKGTVSRASSDYDELLGWSVGKPVRATGGGTRVLIGHWVGDPLQESLDAYASGPFSLWGRKHDLVMGVTASRTDTSMPIYGGWKSAAIDNYYTWDGVLPAQPALPVLSVEKEKEKIASAYVSTRLRATDALSVILGARITDWERDTGTLRSEKKVTPYAGIVYDIDANWSAYGSYTSIFQPQSIRDINGNYIDPLLGNGYELGVKGEFFHKRLNLSGALYQIEQDNLGIAYVPAVYYTDGSQLYRVVSGTRTRGFELDASGELKRNWQGSASFSRSLTQDRTGARVDSNVPQNTFKLFTSYTMPKIGQGLTVGGGLRWQSDIYNVSTEAGALARFTQKAYAIADLMARYKISPNLTATLNLYNLSDKKYYTGTGNAYYGAPFNVRVGLDGRF